MITVKSDAFTVLVKAMAEFVASSTNEPVLASAHLVAKDNLLTGMATNRSVTAHIRIGARVDAPAEFLLGPAKLKDVGYAEPVIALEAAAPRLTIKDGGFKLQVPILAADGAFPEIPWFEGEGAEVEVKDLKKKLGPVLSIVNKGAEDLTGVVRIAFVRTDSVQMISFSGTDKNTVVTTILRCSVPASLVPNGPVREVLVKADALDDVQRHLPGDGKVQVGVRRQGEHGALQVSDGVSRTFTITGSDVRFPDLRAFEQTQKFVSKATVAIGDWVARMKNIKGALKEKKEGEVAHSLTFAPGTSAPVTPGSLKWSLRDRSGEVSGDGEFPIAYDGPAPIRLCIGHRYLNSVLTALADLGVDNADFHLGEAEAGQGGAVTMKPVRIVPAGEAEVQFLVALVRPDQP